MDVSYTGPEIDGPEILERLRHACERFPRHYDAVRDDDVPFAEDCVGDQWLDVDGFFAAVEADPSMQESADGVSLRAVPAHERHGGTVPVCVVE